MSIPLALGGILLTFIIFLLFLNSEKEGQVKFCWIWLYVIIQVIALNIKGFMAGHQLHISTLYAIHISTFFLLYHSVALSKIDYKYILYPLGYVCILMSLFSILECLGLRQFKYDVHFEPGMLGNPTNTAMYIAASAPFLLLHKRGSVWFVVPVIATLLLKSASGFLGTCVVVVAYLILKKYWFRLSFLGVFSLGLIGYKFNYLLELFTPDSKLFIWNLAIRDWMKSPWLGLGLGHFYGQYIIQESGTYYRFMHNHYLYVLYTLGIIGLILLGVFLVPILKNHQKVLPFVSVISVMIMSLCSVPMRVYPLVLLMAVCLGVLTKEE